MSVSCQDIFDCSSKINSTATCEADHRAAIGRAYYASYHCAKNFHDGLASPGYVPAQGGMHSILTHQLQNPTVTNPDLKKKSKQIGFILQTLKINRVKADYHVLDNISENDVSLSIKTAERLLKL